MRGDCAGAHTQTIVGSSVVAQVTTQARRGVTDTLKLAPGASQVGFASGRGTVPPYLQMMVRARDGSSRSIQAKTTSGVGGQDSVAFDVSRTTCG